MPHHIFSTTWNCSHEICIQGDKNIMAALKWHIAIILKELKNIIEEFDLFCREVWILNIGKEYLSTNFVQLSVCVVITGQAPSNVFFPSVLHKPTEAVLQTDVSLFNLKREGKSCLCQPSWLRSTTGRIEMVYPGGPWLEWSCGVCPLGGVRAMEQAQANYVPQKWRHSQVCEFISDPK